MQVVILAAGRGTRMGELTESLPKPMLRVCGKNLIEHKILALPPAVTEIIIVVGYREEKIKTFFGSKYLDKNIKYVVQEKLDGTAGALWQAKPLLTGHFLVLNGDDLYSKEDLAKCLLTKDWAVLVKEVSEPLVSGQVILNKEGQLKDIVEGAELKKGDLINIGAYVLSPDIFNYEPVKIRERAEWGLPQTIMSAVSHRNIGIIKCKNWLPMTSPEDIKKAEATFN